MNKPKILLILHLPPPVHGAAMVGQYIKNSIEVNSHFDCTYINLSTSKTVDDIGKSSFSKYYTFLRLYVNVLINILHNRFDLCYITINSKGSGFYKEMVIVAIVKLFRIPVVYHYHNKGIAENQTKWYNHILYKFQFQNSRAIILSKLLYNDVKKYLPIRNTYICSNGIPQSNYLLQIKPKNEVPILLFLSNMMESKGVYVLLEACHILHKRSVKFKVYFAGSWGDILQNDFFDKITMYNLENIVEYVGAKYGRDKNLLLANSNIFVFPTFYHNETFGLVNLEAMQHYLPIISTNEGAIPEIVEDGVNGFIVPQKDAQALANKIEYLIKNTEIAQQMGKSGYEKYMNNYTLEIFEKNFVRTISQVIADFKEEKKKSEKKA